jgi:hypothetical protein
MADPPKITFLAPPPRPVPWWNLTFLATLLLLIYAGTIASAIFFLKNDTLVTSLLGSVPVTVMAAINYFFGSSAGSAKKDDAQAVAAANQKPGGP